MLLEFKERHPLILYRKQKHHPASVTVILLASRLIKELLKGGKILWL